MLGISVAWPPFGVHPLRPIEKGFHMPRDASTDKPLVELVNVTKIYPPDVVAVEDVSLRIYKGEILFLTGMSGAGKTTLIKLICRLETPTRGLIEVAGRDLAKISTAGVQRMRQKIGVAYQDFRLLDRQTVLQNIAMAMEVTYAGTKVIRTRVEELLALLNLSDKRDKFAGDLSRGEQQRVALARAAANGPSLLLADEPTGNLDRSSAQALFELMRQLNEKLHTSFIVVTHDIELAGRMERSLRLVDGILLEGFSARD